jgi:hypothetical protein
VGGKFEKEEAEGTGGIPSNNVDDSEKSIGLLLFGLCIAHAVDKAVEDQREVLQHDHLVQRLCELPRI